MMFNLKLAASIGALTVLVGSSIALGFGTTAVVNGNTYNIGGGVGVNGIAVTKVGNTISFALPNGVAIGTNKTITLEYFVQATAGNVLQSINQIAGNGVATGLSNVSIATSFAGPGSETAPTINYGSGSTFPAQSYSFTTQPVQWNKVTTVINLQSDTGLAKVSTYSANFTEVVPEPLTIAVLSSGLIGLAARKKRNLS